MRYPIESAAVTVDVRPSSDQLTLDFASTTPHRPARPKTTTAQWSCRNFSTQPSSLRSVLFDRQRCLTDLPCCCVESAGLRSSDCLTTTAVLREEAHSDPKTFLPELTSVKLQRGWRPWKRLTKHEVALFMPTATGGKQGRTRSVSYRLAAWWMWWGLIEGRCRGR